MKLKEFNFNSIVRPWRLTNLAIRMGDGKWYEELTIEETLKSIPLSFADATIKTTRWYFDTFVIELEELPKEIGREV